MVPLFPSALVRWLTAGLGALCCIAYWPVSSLRVRCVERGIRVSPGALGACYGRNLAILLGASCPLSLTGWTGGARAPGQQAQLFLTAHLGPWEAGGRVLAQLGLDPAVIAAPWPGLPRTAKAVARLRSRNGVKTFFRGPAGWRAATGHLRAGGSVVVLVDSVGPSGPQRRPSSFVDEVVAAPDALVAWAQRHGAGLWVAAGRSGGFDLHALPHQPGQVAPVADQALALLRAAALAQPSQWGWVRAVASWAVLCTLCGLGCRNEPLPPPLPLDPSAWLVEAGDVRWDGPIPGHGEGHLSARRVEGRWEDGAPHGHFEDVKLSLGSPGSSLELASLDAASADGSWPAGPLHLQGVRWRLAVDVLREVPEALRSGTLDQATWLGPEGWRCGGCLLEQLAPVVTPSVAPSHTAPVGADGARSDL